MLCVQHFMVLNVHVVASCMCMSQPPLLPAKSEETWSPFMLPKATGRHT